MSSWTWKLMALFGHSQTDSPPPTPGNNNCKQSPRAELNKILALQAPFPPLLYLLAGTRRSSPVKQELGNDCPIKPPWRRRGKAALERRGAAGCCGVKAGAPRWHCLHPRKHLLGSQGRIRPRLLPRAARRRE